MLQYIQLREVWILSLHRSRWNLMDVSAGTVLNSADPLRPFTSCALRGHAMLDEWGQPLAFQILITSVLSWLLSAGLIPKSLNIWVGGDGWECPTLLLGKKNGSGSSRSPARFYFDNLQGSPMSLRQVANVRGLHTSSLTVLPSPVISSSAMSFQLEDTLASFCLSLSFCWQKPQKKCTDFSADTRKEQLSGNSISLLVCRSVLTRLLALIFLVSTLFSAVIFLIFSWASFSLWEKKSTIT